MFFIYNIVTLQLHGDLFYLGIYYFYTKHKIYYELVKKTSL